MLNRSKVQGHFSMSIQVKEKDNFRNVKLEKGSPLFKWPKLSLNTTVN